MPLTRDNVTAAARIMLPAYPAHAIFYGLLYAFDPGDRYERAPGLAFARVMMDMWQWGLILLAAASIMVAALSTHNRRLEIGVLYGYAAVNVVWAAIYFGAPFVSPDAAYGGPGHVLLVATACIASAVSLQHGEVQ